MFSRQNATSLRKMVVLTGIAVGMAVLAGCQTYPYSELENEVYNYVNKFSRKIPKVWAKNRMPDERYQAYHEPTLVLSTGKKARGSGRLVIGACESSHSCLIASGYVDQDDVDRWTKSRGEDAGKLKPGSIILFLFLRTQTGSESVEAVILVKDQEAVGYRKVMNEWRRLEMDVTKNWVNTGPFAWLEHFEEQAGQGVPNEQVQKYSDLGSRFANTYFKKEMYD